MQKKTRTTRSSVKSPVDVEVTPLVASPKKSKFPLLLIIVLLVGISGFLLAKKYKNLLVVAFVNTTPISRFQLNEYLLDRYGKSSLDEIVNATLVRQFAKQNGITVSKVDTDKEISTLEQRLGGKEALKASMDQFGYDDKKLLKDITELLLQRKLAEKLFPITVDDKEVQDYFTQNKVLFDGKKLDDVKEDIKQTITQQKLQAEFGKWFQEQKQKAKVQLFI